MTSPVYLVDAPIYIFRAYFSMPDTFFDTEGRLVNAVYGYTSFLLDFLNSNPEFASFAFDESLSTCYRNEIYPEYKANRELPDENLEYQLQCCYEVTRLLGFHATVLKNFEADDIIGTLATRFSQHPSIIVTRDKDLGQLLREQDQIWDFAANEFSGPAEVEKKFGVRPDQIADYLALAGDAVDNIPGAPGIGAKTASQLLGHFGSLANLLENVRDVPASGVRGAAKIQNTLETHRDILDTYRQITGIHCEVPMTVEIDDLRLGPINAEALLAFAAQLKFGQRILKGLEAQIELRGAR